MQLKNKIKSIGLLFFLNTGLLLNAQSFPQIKELSSKDFVFRQYQQEVEEANKATFQNKETSPAFYVYKAKKDDTLFSIAARCCVPIDTLAPLNNISESTENVYGKNLILPSQKGLFIALEPKTPVELLLAKEHSSELLNKDFPIYTFGGKKFYFMKNEVFSPTERAFFLNTGMYLPLEDSVLTSSFGMRQSPISGKWLMHHGIDMASPVGSKVMACKTGIVKNVVKNDSVYGNYIIIQHANEMISLYAHLSTIDVKRGESVKGGQKIAEVGLTGLTTGPHLHFEININGSYKDPQKMFSH